MKCKSCGSENRSQARFCWQCGQSLLQDSPGEPSPIGGSGKQPPARKFDLKKIRILLMEGFDDGELRRLCYDEPDFRPVYEKLAQGVGKDRIIDELIEYAERKELVEALLILAKELNPVKYKKHQPYIVATSPTSSSVDQGKSQGAVKPLQGRQIALDGGINIHIDSFHGGRVNIGSGEQASRVSSSSESVSGQASSSPDPQSSSSSPFKLQLIQRSGLEFEVRAMDTPMGEPQAVSRLPYTAEELMAVLKALRAAENFSPTQLDILKQLGLLTNSHFVSDLHQRVGQSLYHALMPKDIHTAFQMALNQARPLKQTVALQLRFDEHAVALAQYPWELLFYRRALLPSRAVELTRYVSYPEAITTLPVSPPLRLLYIPSRPTDLPDLSEEREQTTVRQALDTLEAENLLKVDVLPQATYEALLSYLETETVHILHFDGHGVFARRCPQCGAMNYPRATPCQAPQGDAVCGQEIATVEPYGYLAFEAANRQTRWISSHILGNLLFNRPLHLAVLSACRSSNVGGETLFGGTALALIQAGVPAVVATQLPIRVDVVIKFMRGFYQALTRFKSVPAAVNAGRLHIFDTGEWFMPTLYLRSKDDAGYLFQKKET